MSFLVYPGLGLPVWLPVLASSLGSGLGMEPSPVVFVVDANCPGLCHPAYFPGWHCLCSHPRQFTFLTSG